MKKAIIIATALLLSAAQTFAAKPKQKQEDSPWKYRPECMYRGTDGIYTVNFWSFSEKKFDENQAAMEAIHIVLFVGAKAKPGCQAEPFLIHPDTLAAREDMRDFFENEFFVVDGGYRNYIVSFTKPYDKEGTKGGTLYRNTIQVDRPRLEAFLITKGFLKDPYAD